MGLIVDREQLSEALGVSDSTIGSWEPKGLPVVRRGRGRGSRSLYDLDKVRAWQRETGLGLGAHMLAAQMMREERTPAAPVAAAEPASPAFDDDDLEALAAYPALEGALLALPAALAKAGLAPDAIDQALAQVLETMRRELLERGQSPETCDLLRDMLAEERARPGTWTTTNGDKNGK